MDCPVGVAIFGDALVSQETVSTPIRMLSHGHVELALHELASGRSSGERRDGASPKGLAPYSGRSTTTPLLLLHALGGRTSTLPTVVAANWRGPVFGLDFTGHGVSTCPVGGGYSCELLMADADAALREIGPAVILGSGIGGYVGLLVAGAAPSRVSGVIVSGGSGLAGGGTRPGSESIVVPPHTSDRSTPDPFALVELSTDVRPPHYVASFVRHFVTASSLDQPVAVCTAARPAWLGAVVEEFGVSVCALNDALDLFAAPSKNE